MFRFNIRPIALIVATALMSQIVSPIWLNTYADNTVYYVDATGGSDGANGLSSTGAWQTLGFVSTQTFLPGDQILLKCGETWTNDTLTLNSSGSVGNEIIVGTYGSCSSSSVATLAGTGVEQIHIASGASNINISGITFSNVGTGVVIDTASNIQVTQNRFQNVIGVGVSSSGTNTVTIQQNFFNIKNGALGVSTLSDSSIVIDGNTFSGGLMSVDFINSADSIISGNTFYLPSTSALSIVENSGVVAGTVMNNIVSGNIFLTRNTTVPMISIDDQNDDIGVLATLSGNKYINTYKYNTSVVDILAAGTGTTSYDKNSITNIDATATNFNNFGYSNYTGNETRLLVNTGATATDISCPAMTVCAQQVDLTNTSIAWPKNVDQYSSQIVLWNNSPNILNVPACTLNPSASPVANGDPVTLTWTTTNGTGTTMTEPVASGGTVTNPVPNNGSGVYYPPHDDDHNVYTLTTYNEIGSKTCTADVPAQNNPPLQVTFYATGSEDALSITGILQATDSSGDTIYFERFTNSSHGTTNVDPFSGLVEYTPVANYCGTDTFQWRAYDQFNRYSDPATGTITILCTNDAPVAVDDTLPATGGVLGVLDVVANDTDIDSPYQTQTYTVSGVTLPLHGVLTESGSVFEYTPDFAYIGVDTFTYVAIDQSGAVSNTGTVTINVAPGMNIAPVVSSSGYTLSEDGSIDGTFSGSDQNGDTLSFSATVLPLHGTVNITATGFTYTPNANYNGSDSFDFVANDGTVDSNTGTISLTITSVPDAPNALDDTIGMEMNTTSDLDVMANDSDADEPYQAQTLTLSSIVSGPTSGTASIVGNKIRYTPNNLFTGSDILTYNIVDQDTNTSNTATVTINVSTTNQVPVADPASFNLSEDIPLTQTLSGSDPDATPVTFVLDTDVSHGVLTLSSTGGFVYTPTLNYNGTDSFTFHVTDGVFTSTTQTVTLTIDPQNDNPLAVADTFTGTEDTPIDTAPLSNDSDVDVGDTFVLNSVTVPLHGTAVMSGNLITYTPNVDYCGTDTFEYTTIDLSGATSNVGSVTMSVTCVNDAPIAMSGSYTATGNVVTNTGNILTATLSGTDVDIGDILTYNIVNTTLSGTLILTGSAFSYEPNIGFTGSDTFTFTVTDTGGLVSTGTIALTVIPNTYNAVPTAHTGTFVTNEDVVLSDVVLGTDVESGALAYILDSSVSSGTLALSSTGLFTYTPNANFHGTDSFTFHVNDGEFSSATVPVTITINSVNDLPIAVSDSMTGTEDNQIIVNPILNDTDVDGDTLSLATYAGGAHGTVTASGNTITYTPVANYCGTDSLGYTTVDTNSGSSLTGTISLTVTCVNDVPTATGETLSATEDTNVLIPVLANDSDVDVGDTLSIANLTQPGTGGTVSISGTGVLFVPTPNFCTSSPTTFTYQARDTSGALSSGTTVTISSIACVNDIPTSLNGSYTMTGNVVINSGTILSGGILTGYLATNNTVSGNLLSTDLDGDVVTFTIVTPSSHGTGTLSSTGFFTYIPTPGYIGNDSLTFTVTDGTGTSSVYTITLVVQDPNPPVVVVEVAPRSGGGGGGSQSFPSVVISKQTTTTSQITSSSTGLTSQLLLGNRSISQNAVSRNIILNTLDTYITPIANIVETVKIDPVTSRERALAIRSAGQKFIQDMTQSIILESVVKAETMKSTQAQFETMKSTIQSSSREYNALNFVIRLIKRERIKIEKGVTTVKYLMSI